MQQDTELSDTEQPIDPREELKDLTYLDWTDTRPYCQHRDYENSALCERNATVRAHIYPSATRGEPYIEYWCSKHGAGAARNYAHRIAKDGTFIVLRPTSIPTQFRNPGRREA